MFTGSFSDGITEERCEEGAKCRCSKFSSCTGGGCTKAFSCQSDSSNPLCYELIPCPEAKYEIFGALPFDCDLTALSDSDKAIFASTFKI
jgi:hypothetical protein